MPLVLQAAGHKPHNVDAKEVVDMVQRGECLEAFAQHVEEVCRDEGLLQRVAEQCPQVVLTCVLEHVKKEVLGCGVGVQHLRVLYTLRKAIQVQPWGYITGLVHRAGQVSGTIFDEGHEGHSYLVTALATAIWCCTPEWKGRAQVIQFIYNKCKQLPHNTYETFSKGFLKHFAKYSQIVDAAPHEVDALDTLIAQNLVHRIERHHTCLTTGVETALISQTATEPSLSAPSTFDPE